MNTHLVGLFETRKSEVLIIPSVVVGYDLKFEFEHKLRTER